MNAILEQSIANLEATSKALEAYANRKENYNSPYASMLEMMSWEMYKQANELREVGDAIH